ncbi:MAG: diaminopimelate epimerase [Desulfitobacteriaceae bacterium]|nr:diaminopimelate epimerase [Desulfitobacteriaceae bacterium]MDD4752279.1 diaminopimelate epimerase [Desulfitobacteriaceae bacterium]
MNFMKMHGIGNDFVIVNGFRQSIPEDISKLAQMICHRQFGVGADGLVLVLPSKQADLRMRIFNPDGSEPEMCGNAIRCVAKFAYTNGLTKEKGATVETLAGIIRPELIFKNGCVSGIKVDMGEPRLDPTDIPVNTGGKQVVSEQLIVEGEKLYVTAVSMGNPHCLVFVEDILHAPVKTLGPKLETHNWFPVKTNVEFIQVLNHNEVKMRVWERGVGETLACGTGACATVVACVLNGKTGRKITVHLTGGDLLLEWAENNHVFMTGPAEEVFEGRYIALK